VSYNAKELAADKRLQREYGITLEEYNKVLAYQKGVCAICKRPPKEHKRLAVEHRHDTGRIFGLCCWHCNRAIAAFKDNVEWMRNAVKYFNKPPVEAVLGIIFTAPGSVGSKKRARLLQKRKSISRTEQSGQ
jgi:hypothetical protein